MPRKKKAKKKPSFNREMVERHARTVMSTNPIDIQRSIESETGLRVDLFLIRMLMMPANKFDRLYIVLDTARAIGSVDPAKIAKHLKWEFNEVDSLVVNLREHGEWAEVEEEVGASR